MFSTPEFWVFVAFCLLIGAFGKRAYVFATQTLDQHSQKITDQIAKAEALYEEAQSLLNSYKQKHEDAEKQAAEIISHAERDAQEYKSNSEREFELFIKQKEKALVERLMIQQEEAKLKLRKEATEEAVRRVEELIASSPDIQKKIKDISLKDIMGVTGTM
jgi:F-type H+-transporting ATPase subunit b